MRDKPFTKSVRMRVREEYPDSSFSEALTEALRVQRLSHDIQDKAFEILDLGRELADKLNELERRIIKQIEILYEYTQNHTEISDEYIRTWITNVCELTKHIAKIEREREHNLTEYSEMNDKQQVMWDKSQKLWAEAWKKEYGEDAPGADID